MRNEIIGDCTLYLGACEDLPNLIDKFDAILSDPPYGIAYSPGGGGGGIRDKNGKRYKKQFSGKDIVINDNRPFNPQWMLNLNVPTILWGGNHFADKLPNMPSWFVWDKKCGTATNDFADCEMAWSNLGKPARCLQHLWNGMLKDSERGIQRVHPTQKPIAVMEWCIKHFSDECITFFDPYMGSGTTGVACVKMGKKFIGCEIDENHFETACRRIREAYAQPDMFVAPPEPKAEQVKLL